MKIPVLSGQLYIIGQAEKKAPLTTEQDVHSKWAEHVEFSAYPTILSVPWWLMGALPTDYMVIGNYMVQCK